MELSVNSIIPADYPLKYLPVFKPGDRLTLKILKRIEAFRYLVKMNGQTFEVNSSILLNPNDLILIELQKTKPRLVFNFIENISGSFSHKNSTQLGQTLRFGNHPLTALFIEWSIKLGLPIRKSEFNLLRDFYDRHCKNSESIFSVLLNYFWGRLKVSTESFKDPLFFMRLLYEDQFIEKQKEMIKKKKEEKTLTEEQFKLVDSMLNRFTTDFSSGDAVDFPSDPDRQINSFPAVSSALKPNTVEVLENQKEETSNVDSNFQPLFLDVMKYLYSQYDRFKANQWIVFSIKFPGVSKKYFSFFRKSASSKNFENEFLLIFYSNKFGDIGVNGKLINKELYLKIYYSHQGLSGSVDKYNNLLQEKLQNAKFNLKKMDFVRSKDLYKAITKLLLSDFESKIEVII